MRMAKQIVKVGITTEEIDYHVHKAIIEHGAYPSPLNYRGFPKSVCTSVNEVAVHGIPNSRCLQNGDLLSVDISLFYGGVHGDLCETFLVGNVDESGRRLVDICRQSLDEAISICGPGVRMSTIGNTISLFAKKSGYSVSECCNGHGIGSVFHALPDVSHVANNRPGKMQPGMTFTIEPVLCEGSSKLYTWEDEWTIVTSDGMRTAQFEETVLITEDGVEVLTFDYEQQEA
ncbi:predicted protein [Nematostella vectensis]|uniref:Methionine aminopeptidase n=2 Tax=Nematostella vectensis TaxID=45351 RepID=A7RWZ8_NEMVE|nr:predicted protein [Nematostella vectensis]|eukprot:XP_001636176.1 predicted protein [Nematostella vectensis]